jgi:hypothetical protein
MTTTNLPSYFKHGPDVVRARRRKGALESAVLLCAVKPILSGFALPDVEQDKRQKLCLARQAPCFVTESA